MNWRENLITSPEEVRGLLNRLKRIAVLGIKTEEHASQPAHYVPRYLAAAGLEIVPVPVYYPEASFILGEKIYRKLADIPGAIDLVDVFRRPEDITGHVDDILAKMPGAVWFQSGIRNMEAAEKLARAGIKVVQDRCLMIDYQQAVRGR